MTCGSCVTRVKSELLKLGDILSAEVQLAAPQAVITMSRHLPLARLQEAISKAGPYIISEAGHANPAAPAVPSAGQETNGKNLYFPVYLIFGFISLVTVMIQLSTGSFNWMQWMGHFMAGFFLVFSFFKFLNLRGFARNYQSYDIVAKQWYGWGYVYAFTELALGLAFLTGFNSLLTNAVTFVLMGVSLVGVLQTVLNKRKIRCACLGDVFNLPMSTVTVIEDAVMIVMSGIMLVTHF